MTEQIEEYQDAFARIERAIQGGETDLRKLGFWKLVRQVKLDPRLAEHWAPEVGRIDRLAFERRVRLRLPVWLGNGIFLLQMAVLVAAVPVALGLAAGPENPRPALAGLVLLVAAVGLSVGVHGPAHWLVGRLAHIRFLAYFLGGPLRIPGLKIDYESYLRASPGARAGMHAAGAIASKIAPFAVFVPTYLRHRAAGYELLPEWSLWGILGFGVIQILTDVLWSVKHSDWKKVRRERRLARAQEATRTVP